MPGGSHTRVLSIDGEHLLATALMWTSLRRTHSYGNLPYNITDECNILIIYLLWREGFVTMRVIKGRKGGEMLYLHNRRSWAQDPNSQNNPLVGP